MFAAAAQGRRDDGGGGKKSSLLFDQQLFLTQRYFPEERGKLLWLITVQRLDETLEGDDARRRIA